MMTVTAANYLLALDKFIEIDEQQVNNLDIELGNTVRLRWKLISPADTDQVFLVDIKESEKKQLAISLHHQDDDSKGGLLRIDYHSRHRNPENVLSGVPANFAQYAGQYLDNYSGHIHYVIDGYAPLAWAIPLDDDPFPFKDVQNLGDVASVIRAFCQKINLRTTLNITTQMRLL